MELRPYQNKGKVDIYDAWRLHKKIMFQLVTGGGKTVIFVNIIRDILKKKKRVILIAHRQELIEQAWQTLHKNNIFSGIIKADHRPDYSLPCQVASIQTLARKKRLPAADVIIFDEAHHCQDDNSYGKVLKDFFPNAYALGVTATPYRLSGQGFKDIFAKLICSKSYPELVDDGYLTPFRYFICSIPKLADLRLSKGDYREADAEKAMQLAPLVESYREHCYGKRGVVFAVNINHSETIVEQYNAAGIKAAHLDGDTPKDQRELILKMFKRGDIWIISNVGIITEGFDFPEMDFVQLARPTLSLSLYLQMVGRPGRVAYDIIKDCVTAGERKAAIANSDKTHAIILDNAGCWEAHGMPDQKFDWQGHFEGFDKKKRAEINEVIEMYEFVAEDENGYEVRSRNPEEVEGMRLIEVNAVAKKSVQSFSAAVLLDKTMMDMQRIRHVKKKAFATFFKFIEHCKKNDYYLSPEVWNLITEKLSLEPGQEIKRAERYQQVTEQGIREQYGHNQDEMKRLIAGLHEKVEDRIERQKVWKIPSGFIRKQREEYIAWYNQREQLKQQATS